jgi:outer membrane biosynthesis protein TonB
MFSNRIFQICLLVSLITHGAILLQNPNLNLLPQDKNPKKVELRYLKKPQEIKVPQKQPTPSKKEPLLKLPSRIIAKEITPPPFINREEIFNKNKEGGEPNLTFIKPAFTKPDVIAIKKKVTLPPLDLDKINNPSYINYYQIVREKIRRAAYQNYSRAEMGEIYLSFIISNDGYLREARLIEEKSAPNPYLCQIALASIRDASPFPNFPKELDYPYLSFNVILSFEIE